MDITGGRLAFFSTPDLLHGRVIGNAEVSDAVRALRHTIPDATRYSPTVIPRKDEDPHGYGCRPSDDHACLNERRFEVSARYSTANVSRATAKRLDTYGLRDSGALFYFFGPDNPEMLLKVLNGCWLNNHWWVFGSAATDLMYEVAIEDLAEGGGTVGYRHNGGGVIVADNGYSTGSGVIADTSAFPCGQSAATQVSKRQSVVWSEALARPKYDQDAASPVAALQETGNTTDYGCASSCLQDWRFNVGVRFGGPGGARSGSRRKLVHGLGNSGALFYFFGPDNPEMLPKVVNGCAFNGHWWVFGSAATDLNYSVRISDAVKFEGRTRLNDYRHKGGGRIAGSRFEGSFRDPKTIYTTRSGVINDTSAFPCNP